MLNTEKNIDSSHFSSNSIDDEENFAHLENEFFTPQKKKSNLFQLIGKLLILMIQGVTMVFLFPLEICTVILAVLLGIEIYLVITGSALLGIALITFSLIGFIQISVSLIWKLVFKAEHKLHMYGLSFLLLTAAFGAGTVLSIYELSQFSIQDSPMYTHHALSEEAELILTDGTSIIEAKTNQIEISVQDTLDENQIHISYTAPDIFQLKETSNDQHYALEIIPNSTDLFAWIQDIISTTFEGLHENILYQYDMNQAIHIHIKVHPSLLHRIETLGNQVIIHESTY